MAYMGIYKSPEDIFIRSTSIDTKDRLLSKGCILIIELKGRDISVVGIDNTITSREYLSKKPLLEDIDEREKFYKMKEKGIIS